MPLNPDAAWRLGDGEALVETPPIGLPRFCDPNIGEGQRRSGAMAGGAPAYAMACMIEPADKAYRSYRL